MLSSMRAQVNVWAPSAMGQYTRPRSAKCHTSTPHIHTHSVTQAHTQECSVTHSLMVNANQYKLHAVICSTLNRSIKIHTQQTVSTATCAFYAAHSWQRQLWNKCEQHLKIPGVQCRMATDRSLLPKLAESLPLSKLSSNSILFYSLL